MYYALIGKKTASACADAVINVIRAGFEPATHSLEGCCSIQLSYRTKPFNHLPFGHCLLRQLTDITIWSFEFSSAKLHVFFELCKFITIFIPFICILAHFVSYNGRVDEW